MREYIPKYDSVTKQYVLTLGRFKFFTRDFEVFHVHTENRYALTSTKEELAQVFNLVITKSIVTDESNSAKLRRQAVKEMMHEPLDIPRVDVKEIR